MNSLTEENYLKAIYKLLEKGGGEVSTNAIAARVNTKAASVTDMLKKLSDKKLINYKKYQGVTLTRKGELIALNIIRKHRLWECFLVEKLNFEWDEVHDVAEQLEHIRSEKLISSLDNYLGNPKFDPHGDPIPDSDGKITNARSALLSTLKVNSMCIMTGVVDHSPAFLQYLKTTGITLGNKIHIKQKIEFDGSLIITVNGVGKIQISNEVAKNILIKN